MFPLVSVWVRQCGALKLHPYNFVIQKLFVTVILTNPDKFEATNCYCNPCIYNNVICTCSYLPLPYPTPTWHLPTIFSICYIPYYNKTHKHPYSGSTMLNIFSDHVHLNIFSSQHILRLLLTFDSWF